MKVQKYLDQTGKLGTERPTFQDLAQLLDGDSREDKAGDAGTDNTSRPATKRSGKKKKS